MPLYDDEIKYSVKEASKILGISEQSLRYYDRIGLLEPYYRDPENRYRYYTINQFYLLEQFKYAKSLGLTVPEYASFPIKKEQVESGDYERTAQVLEGLLACNVRERDRLERCIAELEEMRNSLQILETHSLDGPPFNQQMPLRCAYAVDHDPSGPFENTSVRMRSTRAKYKDILTEHYGLLLSVDAAREGRIEYVKQYVVLSDCLEESDEIIHLPAGTYASFLHHAFRPDERFETLAEYLADRQPALPYLVADEVNFHESVNDIVHAVRVLE